MYRVLSNCQYRSSKIIDPFSESSPPKIESVSMVKEVVSSMTMRRCGVDRHVLSLGKCHASFPDSSSSRLLKQDREAHFNTDARIQWAPASLFGTLTLPPCALIDVSFPILDGVMTRVNRIGIGWCPRRVWEG